MEEALYLRLDAGSTTVKLALVDARGTLLEARYERHGAAVRATLRTLLEDLAERRPGLVVRPAMTGSAALRLAGRGGRHGLCVSGRLVTAFYPAFGMAGLPHVDGNKKRGVPAGRVPLCCFR